MLSVDILELGPEELPHLGEILRELRYRLFDVRVLRRTGAGASFGAVADLGADDAFARRPEEPHVLALPLRGLPLGAPTRSPAKAFANASLAAKERSFRAALTSFHSAIASVTSAACRAGTYSVRVFPSALSVSCQCSDPPLMLTLSEPSCSIPRPIIRFRALAFEAQALLSDFFIFVWNVIILTFSRKVKGKNKNSERNFQGVSRNGAGHPLKHASKASVYVEGFSSFVPKPNNYA